MPATLLILGATGETGKQCLAAALASPSVTGVVSVGRRAPPVDTASPGYSKLQHQNVDFDKLLENDAAESQKLQEIQADAIVCALGTTKAAAGSMDKFVRIDRDYVLAAAKAARVQGKHQSFAYCSSNSASSSSLFPYLKSKGLTEEGIAAAGYDDLIVFRPALLAVPGGRGEARFMESIAAKFTGLVGKVTDSVEIKTPILGSAMVRAALEGREKLASRGLGHEETLANVKAWVVGNGEAIKLGSQS